MLLAATAVHFEHPRYLMLLALIPVLVWLSFRSLAGLGRARRAVAILFRCVVVGVMVMALAGAQWVQTRDQLAVIFAFDRSNSVTRQAQPRQVEFARQAEKSMRPGDQMAVLAFDGRSAIEQLPMGKLGIQFVSEAVEPDQTNVAAAMRMAMALFPADAARRLVVVSDGNENVDNLLKEADWFAANKVPVDVVPIRFEYGNEVMIERLIAPPTAKAEETVSLKVVLRSEQRDGRPVKGHLRIYHNDTLIRTQSSDERGVPVELTQPLESLTIPVPLWAAGAHRFRAEFTPDASDDPTAAPVDSIDANNVGQAFTIVSGQGPILVLTTPEDAASAELLADALRREKLVVKVMNAGEAVLDPIRLLDYSLVVLSNVPASALTEEEQAALTSYVRDGGGGLAMVGGDQSFGAGGWMGSPIEDVMPVSFDVKHKKQIPKGALCLVMHACEIPRGNFWGERVAVAAVKTLSSRDEVGVLSYQWVSEEQGYWVVPLQTVGDKRAVVQRIMQMQMGDMPDLDAVMRPAVERMAASDAAVRHMIVISDFDPQEPLPDLYDKMKANNITCSTVAIGYGGHTIDEVKATRIATRTGGKFYRTNNYAELPQIFIKEATIVRRPLINNNPFTPKIANAVSPTVAGLSGEALPQLGGHVVTTLKPLAEMPLARPTSEGVDPLLAHWQVGLGRTVAFTSGMWNRWGRQWVEWPRFSSLWAQIARWASRQSESAAFDVSTSVQGGRGRIQVDALDKNASTLDFLMLEGNLVAPSAEPGGKPAPLRLTQTGPGRYEAEFDARKPGNYLINLWDANHPQTKLHAGVAVPYSTEFRELTSNVALLTQLADRTGGRVLRFEDAARAYDRESLPPAQTRAPAWESLVRWMLVLFLLDVAVRRIAISPVAAVRKLRDWVGELAGRFRPAEASAATLSTLKGTRQRVREDLEAPPRPEAGRPPSRSARYEAPTTQRRSTEELTQALGGASEQSAPVVSRPTKKGAPQDEATYTSRLLKAKRRAREDLEREGDVPPSA